jgi:hypothetical protein
VDGEQGIPPVVRLVKKALELGLRQGLGQDGKSAVEVAAGVLALGGQLGQDLDLFFFFLQPGEGGDIPLQSLLLLLETQGFLLVLPGLGSRELFGQGGELGPLSIEVKENLGRLRIFRAVPSSGTDTPPGRRRGWPSSRSFQSRTMK